MDSVRSERAERLARALATVELTADATRANRPKPVNVAAIRRKVGMTQTQFAARFGFAVATLRHWEQGDRRPRGPALVLLNVIARNHRAVLQALK